MHRRHTDIHTHLNIIYILDQVVKCLPKEKTSRMEMRKPVKGKTSRMEIKKTVEEKKQKLKAIQRKDFNRIMKAILMNEFLANATNFGSRTDFWHISKETTIAARSILKRRLKPSQKYLRKMLLKRES